MYYTYLTYYLITLYPHLHVRISATNLIGQHKYRLKAWSFSAAQGFELQAGKEGEDNTGPLSVELCTYRHQRYHHSESPFLLR